MREQLTSQRTYYVSTSGDNACDGRTPETAWRTLQHAWDFIRDSLDLCSRQAIVHAADGVYAPLITSGYVVGAMNAAAVAFIGNQASPWNCVIDGGAGDALHVGAGSGVLMRGFGYRGHRGIVVHDATVLLGWTWFGACSWAHMQAVGPLSRIAHTDSNYTIAGAAPYHVLAEQGAFINVTNCLCTFAGNLPFTAFVHANQCGLVDFTGSAFSGSPYGAIGKKFDIRSNGVVSVNGQPDYVLPGNLPGTRETGGQYV